MPPALEDAVVVITGATSGIGRAAALRFARRGAALALCARSAEPLEEVSRECVAAGAPGVLTRALDVADEDAVEELASATEERFGRIDVWLNDAGTMAYGRFEDIPSAVFRSVVETNLLGTVHGARVALRRFDARGSGVLINMSSIWGSVPSPLASPYIVSKFGVHALSECIAAELPRGGDVHVVEIAPQVVDTPIFGHAANYTGRRARPIPPALSADHVAEGIERLAESPRPKANFGLFGRSLEVLYALAPPVYRRLAHGAFVRGTSGSAEERADGNVLASAGPHQIDGEWLGRASGTLGRAFIDAAAGGIAGLLGVTLGPRDKDDRTPRGRARAVSRV